MHLCFIYVSENRASGGTVILCRVMRLLGRFAKVCINAFFVFLINGSFIIVSPVRKRGLVEFR